MTDRNSNGAPAAQLSLGALAPSDRSLREADALAAVLARRSPGRVVVSDAFELLRSLPDESIDLVITDPPYASLELHRARGTTTRLTTNWFATVPDEKLPELLEQAYRVLKRDRHFFLFCDEVTADVIKQQQGVGAQRQPNGARRCASGFLYWKEVIWAKTTLDGAKIRGGTGYHFRASCERILFFEKGKRMLNDLGVPDVLLSPRSGVAGPAVKPAQVIRTLLAQSSNEGELVLDPFAGSGVVGVEARTSGRRFLLGDIDLAYLDPTLADAAPQSLPRSGPAIPEDDVPPLEPPPLEDLLARAAEGAGELRAAAEAVGWLADGKPTPEMEQLLAVRAKEREAQLRRSLRNLPAAALMEAAVEGGAAGLSLVRAWRAWALSGRRA